MKVFYNWQRSRWSDVGWRTGLVILTLGVVTGFEIGRLIWPQVFGNRGWIILHFLALFILLYLVVTWALDSSAERAGHQALSASQQEQLDLLNKQQQVVLQFGRELVNAESEAEIINAVLTLVLEASEASGASFVPFDEREQPLAATSRGILPPTIMDPWAEHLATRNSLERCRTCERLGAAHGEVCPLLDSAFQLEFPAIQHIHCLPLLRGDRKIGMLTLYLADQQPLPAQVRELLSAIVDETALAMEGLRLRQREKAVLQHLQAVRQKTDLEGLLGGMLAHILATLEADFILLFVQEKGVGGRHIRLQHGNLTPEIFNLAEGLMQACHASREPLMMSDLAGNRKKGVDIRAVLVAPLLLPDGISLGSILAGSTQSVSFSHRHLELLSVLAGHLAVLVNNATILSEVETKTMLDERARLAREIHDGLAQTLGFLKLQVAQLQNYLTRNDYQRLAEGLSTSYATLAEAYLEVRSAIDGLRTRPDDEGVERWLEEQLADLQEASQITTEKRNCGMLQELPPEVQVQLIRIVQEALSNVRKHAHATQVIVECRRLPEEIMLEIQDDGRGFSPDEVSRATQYGLRGMRERAELIGADFQVISKPKAGTTIRIGVYAPKKEKA
jgi:two-component system nitrate/nitrite sensor histidine kinase NarX